MADPAAFETASAARPHRRVTMYRFEPEFEATLEEMRTFVRRHVVPIEKAVLEDQDIDGNADIQALRAEVRDRAWWAPQLPVDHGGMGLSLLRQQRERLKRCINAGC